MCRNDVCSYVYDHKRQRKLNVRETELVGGDFLSVSCPGEGEEKGKLSSEAVTDGFVMSDHQVTSSVTHSSPVCSYTCTSVFCSSLPFSFQSSLPPSFPFSPSLSLSLSPSLSPCSLQVRRSLPVTVCQQSVEKSPGIQ